MEGGIIVEMTESEAIEIVRKEKSYMDSHAGRARSEAFQMAINALENQEKIKEALEMWKAETGGYYGADDETTRFISTLNQILRSDKE